MFALRATPIESIAFVFDNRNPRGTIFVSAARD